MDRQSVVDMVEDYWRAVLPIAQSGNTVAMQEVAMRFERRIDETAALMAPDDGAAFRQMIEVEREQLLSEYQADPAALKHRLGIALGIDGPGPAVQPLGLGEVALRTAVRATVWESIWAIFRAFR